MTSADILFQLSHFGKLLFLIPMGQYDPNPVTYCIRLSGDNHFTHSWWSGNGSSWGPHTEGLESTMNWISRNIRYYQPQ